LDLDLEEVFPFLKTILLADFLLPSPVNSQSNGERCLGVLDFLG